MNIRMIFGSLLIALMFNVVLAVGIGLNDMQDKIPRGEVYGDSAKGSFGCNNFHGDLFYCSATKFFTTHALFMIMLVVLSSYGMSIFLPFLLAFFVWKRRIQNSRQALSGTFP